MFQRIFRLLKIFKQKIRSQSKNESINSDWSKRPRTKILRVPNQRIRRSLIRWSRILRLYS